MRTPKNCILCLILAAIMLLCIGCNKNNAGIPAITEKEKPYAHPEYLITAEQLKGILGDPNLSIIDTRSRQAYAQEHIPGALSYGAMTTLDPNRRGRFNHPKYFSISFRELGVKSSDRFVIYGDTSSARLWLMLYMSGVKVQLLNGGFEYWKAKGYQTNSGLEGKPAGPKAFWINDYVNYPIILVDEVIAAMEEPKKNIIVDARSAEEYAAGHMPGAVNVSWEQLIKKDLTFKNTSDLDKLFRAKGVTPDKQVIIYSNNATRASLIYFTVNKLLGYEKAKVFDGYWLYWVYPRRPLVSGNS